MGLTQEAAAKRPYDLQPYRHLDFSLPISLAPSTRIFHVTKEFGPATMGGLGVMLTALAIAQSESPLLSISVVLPHYSFLRTEFSGGETTHFAELRVPITGRQKGKETEFVGCVVSLLKWEYPCSVDFLDPVSEVDSARDHRSIDIYLVGPGDRTPFDVAFKAKDAGDVYSAYKPLKQEWKDLWFAKAAAELLAFLSFGGDRPYWDGDDLYGDETEEEWELGLEEGLERGRDAAYAKTPAAERGVDVVHLHGATNAMVAHYLREIESFEDPDHNLSPAIVYTLHDSLDEVEYSNLVSNSLAFLNSRDQAPRFRQQLSPYIFGKQLFPSALGIDLADAVTFVSESIARDIVEGRFQFSLRDLVMPSISTRAKERRFVGITNGLDFTDAVKNPFTAPALVQRGLSFPRVGPNITSPSTFFSPTRPTLRLSFSSSKTLAREHLVANFPSLFSPADLHRPLLLFIGRFQYNKGCQFFHPLLTSLSSSSNHSARLVLLGAQNNFPHASLLALQTRFPDHLTLIDSSAVQKELGSLIRMASDLAFVPSFSEAFGLVAAEALLFGMPVITTCVGGLAEFLRETGPRKVEEENEERGERGGNAYLFKLGAGKEGADMGLSAEDSRRGMKDLEPAIRACVEVTLRAIEDWRRRMDVEETPWAEREMFARRLVADALALKWSREKGPIEEVRPAGGVFWAIFTHSGALIVFCFIAVRPSLRPRARRPSHEGDGAARTSRARHRARRRSPPHRPRGTR